MTMMMNDGSVAPMLRWLRCIVVVLALLLSTSCSQPLEKAKRPQLDPITYLPLVTHKVYFDVQIGDHESPSRIMLGLFGTVAPRTVENFVALSDCSHGDGSITGKPLCYRGTAFHRIVTDLGIQGGDFSHGDGTGGESIFEKRFFDDESFQVQHNRPYLLSMANSRRPDTNGSQFMISTVSALWLDGKSVVFGYVLDGQDVVDTIAKQGSYSGKPKVKVTIIDSGSLPVEQGDLKKIPVGAKSSLSL